jgi:hypothetical protein
LTKRKTISKKIRFEVFKRDSFTCQYCGRMAPDVVLEVDHINPVARGGDNDIMNLLTSCFDCNRGKGKRKISDDAVIKKQQQQLKDLNEKRSQLDMMLKWKKELNSLLDTQVNEIENLLNEYTGHKYSEYGRNDCKKQIKEFGFSEVYDSAMISIQTYYDPKKKDSATLVFNKIGGICFNRRKQRDENGD